MKASKMILVAASAAMLAQVAMLGHAGDDDKSRHAREHEEIRAALERGKVLPLARILAIAQEEVPGDVIEVELEKDHGVLIYEIKVLTASGRVREIEIDARQGTVLKIEDD